MDVDVVAATGGKLDEFGHALGRVEHSRRGPEMLRDARLEPLERDRLADDLDTTVLADQLDALHARLGRGDGERADGAVLPFEQRGCRILRLDRLQRRQAFPQAVPGGPARWQTRS